MEEENGKTWQLEGSNKFARRRMLIFGARFQMIRGSRGLVSNALAKRTAIGLHFIQHEARAHSFTHTQAIYVHECLPVCLLGVFCRVIKIANNIFVTS